jgi:hypothetical protein
MYRQIRSLPGQAVGVALPYGLCVAAVNAAACAAYLVAWRFATGVLSPSMVVVAGLLSLVSAALTVLIEMRFPLLDWKVESDLWHHPRKYVAPGAILLLTSLITMFIGGF